MDADRGDVQFAAQSTFVKGLNVLQDVLEPPSPRIDPALGEPIEHERIVGIRTMAEK